MQYGIHVTNEIVRLESHREDVAKEHATVGRKDSNTMRRKEASTLCRYG